MKHTTTKVQQSRAVSAARLSKFIKTALLSVTAFMAAQSVSASDVGFCKKINWKPDRVYHVNAAINRATHVIFPEDMLGSPIVGNQDLWVVEGQRTHMFVKPTSEAAEGLATTITVIGETNTSYEFVFKRNAKKPDTCVRIVRDPGMMPADAIANYQAPNDKLVQLLQNKIGELETNIQTEQSNTKAYARKIAEEALQKYRHHIYTRYGWSRGAGFIGDDVVADVYDDGRFTYIRVFHANKGLMAIRALVEDEYEMVEYQFDAESKVYQIAGIFPEIELNYGEAELTIERMDNQTYGSY